MNATRARLRRIALIGAAGMLAAGVLGGCSEEAQDAAAGAASSAAASVRESASAELSASVAASASAAASGATADACTQADTVKASLDALVGTNIREEGTNTLKARFATFEADVQALFTAAQSQFAVETAAVKASIATLRGAIAGLAESPSVAEAALVRPSLEAVKASTEELIAAVQGAC